MKTKLVMLCDAVHLMYNTQVKMMKVNVTEMNDVIEVAQLEMG